MTDVVYGTENGITVRVQSLGLPGPAGAAPVLGIGTVTTGAPGSSASASLGGTPTAPILNLTIPRGDSGAQGNQGIPGAQGPPPPVVVLNNLGEYPASPVTGTFYVVRA